MNKFVIFFDNFIIECILLFVYNIIKVFVQKTNNFKNGGNNCNE